jgi:alkylation response protein AidB-like acyl-CoA dehydrogenase
MDRVRAWADDGTGPGDDYRRQAAELGWFSMLVPESLGGGQVSDDGVVDATVIAALRGATLQPGGFVGTNVVADALVKSGAASVHGDLLADLVAGERSAVWAAMGPAGNPTPWSGVQLRRVGDGYRLSGIKTLVEDAGRCSHLLVTGMCDDAPVQLLVPTDAKGVRIERMTGLDVTRALFEVGFDDVAADADSLVGAPGGCHPLIERQLRLACVLLSAETVGAMDRDFQDALVYAQDRIAFGRPIGSFQAIKHLLADTSLMLEMGKATVAGAARAVGADEEDAARDASSAKAFIAERGVQLAQNCFQVFGGIGYTWEHDHHLYMRRITSDAALYGGAAWHRERICASAGI